MTRYEQGFLTKCAEYGIDGRELIKQAGGSFWSRLKQDVTHPFSLSNGALGKLTGLNKLINKTNKPLRRYSVFGPRNFGQNRQAQQVKSAPKNNQFGQQMMQPPQGQQMMQPPQGQQMMQPPQGQITSAPQVM